MPTYGGTQKYTEFYNCEEVEGLTSSTTQRYALKNMYVVSNADGVICTNCVERIISEHKGGTGGEVDESVYMVGAEVLKNTFWFVSSSPVALIETVLA